MDTATLSDKRIDVDTHFLPRFHRQELRHLLPSKLLDETVDMFAREAERLGDWRGVRAAMRGEIPNDEVGNDPGRDPEARLDAMRELGFDMQILIPNGPFGNMHGASPYNVSAPLDVRLAMCRLFNNATGKAQADFPESYIGTAIIPFDDIAVASEEVRRAVSELSLKIVVLPFNWLGKNFDEYELYPFWQTLNDLDVTVFVHGITQPCGGAYDHLPRYPAAFAERMRRLHLGTYMGFGMEYSMALGALTLGGVFDEFPNLQFCFFEAGASWMISAMYACDRSFMIEPQCSRSEVMPSELIRAHCLTAIEPMENIAELVSMLGSENYFFGTDFPHPEFQVFHSAGRTQTVNPSGAAAIDERDGISDADKANILGANIARVLSRKF